MRKSKQLWRQGGRWGLVTALLMLSVPAVGAAEPPSEKLQKQIEMFENTVNQMLVDSTNFLVASRHAAGGLYVPGYGVVLTFRASLAGKEFTFDFQDWMKNFNIQHKDNKIIVEIDDWDEEERKEVERELKEQAEELKAQADEIKRHHEEMRQQMVETQRELYEEGKEEMVEILLDYGETLLRLDDNERVMVAVFLGEGGWLGPGLRWDRHDHEEEASAENDRLVVSALMGDIRAYARGSIGEDDMRRRIEVLEY